MQTHADILLRKPFHLRAEVFIRRMGCPADMLRVTLRTNRQRRIPQVDLFGRLPAND